MTSDPNDIIGVAVKHYRPSAVPRASGLWDSRDEPSWHDANILLHLSSAYGFSNKADVDAAFSFGFSAHKDFVTFRNYYAHKNRVTREKAQGVAIANLISGSIHPTEILQASPASSPGTSLFERWFAEFQQTASLLCS